MKCPSLVSSSLSSFCCAFNFSSIYFLQHLSGTCMWTVFLNSLFIIFPLWSRWVTWLFLRSLTVFFRFYFRNSIFNFHHYFLMSSFFVVVVFLKFYFIFKLYNIVLVLPNIEMNPPQVYMCSPSWTLLPLPSPYHPSGSSQCTNLYLKVRLILLVIIVSRERK